LTEHANLEERLLQQAPVQAWRRLGLEGDAPERVEVLHGRHTKAWKRAVYRLAGVGLGGTAVIAKRCPLSRAVLERTVYEEVLPHLPVRGLRFYGFVEEPDAPFAWLFLEEADGDPYSRLVEEHRVLAGRWLGLLHAGAARLPAGARLPDRSPGHYLASLQSSRAILEQHLAHTGPGPDDLAVLKAIVSQYGTLERRWSRVEELCAAVPRTLVHGDFGRKNVQVRASPGGRALLCFDWETVGWGVPAADLGSPARPDLTVYAAVVREDWRLHLRDLERLASVGKLFRYLAAIEWTASWLPHGCLEEPMTKLRIYLSRLTEAMQAAGWGE
jgi:hypothetical protein